MNNIFKKQFLLSLMLIFVPIFVGAIESEESVQGPSDDVRSSKELGSMSDYEKFAATGSCGDSVERRREIEMGMRKGEEFSKGCNLQGMDLRDVLKKLHDEGKTVDFYRANLADTNWGGANVTSAKVYLSNLAGANFVEANITKSSFPEVDLTNADLSGAIFSGVNLDHAKFIGANLPGVTFSGRTRLHNADFTGADLSGVTFIGGNENRYSYKNQIEIDDAKFTGANLSGVTFSGVDLTEVDFTNATGTHVRFFKSRINKAKLPTEILETAEFHKNLLSKFSTVGEGRDEVRSLQEGESMPDYENFAVTGLCKNCDLQGMDLRDALKKLSDEGKKVLLFRADLTGANLSGVNLTNVNLGYANLTGANLSGSTFSGKSNLFYANLTEADLSGVTFVGGSYSLYGGNYVSMEHTNLTRANLSGVTFSGVDLTEVDFTGATGTNVRFFGSKVDKEKLSGEILETAEFHKDVLFKLSSVDQFHRWLGSVFGGSRRHTDYVAESPDR